MAFISNDYNFVSSHYFYNNMQIFQYIQFLERIKMTDSDGETASLKEPPGYNFRQTFFPEVTDVLWNDWHWQFRNRIRTLAQLEKILFLTNEERQALSQGVTLPIGITPYYTGLISKENFNQPLRKTVIPTSYEFIHSIGESNDPLNEEQHMPVPGLVHRYPDRVLLLALDFCATYCRYCTRSRVVGHNNIIPSEKRLEKAINYIRDTTTIRDVLISGGDPLTMSDEKLNWLLEQLRSIPHIEIIRIGTKTPAVMPQRITPDLCKILKKYHPLWMSLHFTHPEECTSEASYACSQLADTGIPLGSQTVLLRGVNDSVAIMKELMQKLLQMRVRPYYLYQCDPILGSAHFRTPIEKGLEIIEGLRGHTSGYAVPTYVIDAPGGGGKIPLQPNYLNRQGNCLCLRNYENKNYEYYNIN
jgi:lysine 2,3-aminomutase